MRILLGTRIVTVADGSGRSGCIDPSKCVAGPSLLLTFVILGIEDGKADHENPSKTYLAGNSSTNNNLEAYCFAYLEASGAGYGSGDLAASRTLRASKPEPCSTSEHGGSYWILPCPANGSRCSRKHLPTQ